MNRIALAAASAALLLGGVGGALAQGTMPAGTAGSTMAPASMPQSQYGGSVDTVGLGYTDALNLLEANGYTGLENFTKSGQEFTASAIHQGKRVQVAVDPSGHIRNAG